MKVIEEQDIHKLAKILAKRVLEQIRGVDNPIIALSGGSTPQLLYENLGKLLRTEFGNQVNQINIIQVDERFVARDHERNNMKMIKIKMGTGPTYYSIPTTDEVSSPEESAMKYEETLNHLLSDKSIDVIILGMGTDGHTASLFPNNTDYIDSLDNNHSVIQIDEESVEDPRISLTSYLINSSKKKMLLIHGEKKKQVLEMAYEQGDKLKYPILQVIDNCEIYSQYQIDF